MTEGERHERFESSAIIIHSGWRPWLWTLGMLLSPRTGVTLLLEKAALDELDETMLEELDAREQHRG